MALWLSALGGDTASLTILCGSKFIQHATKKVACYLKDSKKNVIADDSIFCRHPKEKCMRLFTTQKISRGYAADRPYFHPKVIKRITSYLKLSQKLTAALDVGCGAGMSTRALLEISGKVIGVDSSANMIRSAIRREGLEYVNCRAEELPFIRKFDLITLSGSINWIDRRAFFPKANKMLEEESYLIIYDNNTLGIMEENKQFEKWYVEAFSKRYPKPPRDESPILKPEARRYGFEFEAAENYTNQVTFKLDSFIKYLFTQSNITAALNDGLETSPSIRQWLDASLRPFFGGLERTIRFGGYIWYLKKS